MTRVEVEATYEVIDGIIRSPGKFEGEAVYMPMLWECLLNGEGHEEPNGEVSLAIYSFDCKEFPELAGIRRVWLTTDDAGFVYGRAEKETVW